MDEDLFGAARIDECLNGEPCKALAAESLTGKDAVHFETIRVPGTPGGSGEAAILKDGKDPLFRHIVLLAAVLFPQFFRKPELFVFQLAHFSSHPSLCHTFRRFSLHSYMSMTFRAGPERLKISPGNPTSPPDHRKSTSIIQDYSAEETTM